VTLNFTRWATDVFLHLLIYLIHSDQQLMWQRIDVRTRIMSIQSRVSPIKTEPLDIDHYKSSEGFETYRLTKRRPVG
jgi:hypothetical protein